MNASCPAYFPSHPSLVDGSPLGLFVAALTPLIRCQTVSQAVMIISDFDGRASANIHTKYRYSPNINFMQLDSKNTAMLISTNGLSAFVRIHFYEDQEENSSYKP